MGQPFLAQGVGQGGVVEQGLDCGRDLLYTQRVYTQGRIPGNFP